MAKSHHIRGGRIVELEECRKHFAKLARDPTKRFVRSHPDRPSKWFPHKVPNAEGYGMTDSAAWEFVAEILEDMSQEMETLILDKPKGCVSYVFKTWVPHLTKRIYIKFEIVVPSSGQKICGRSFHLAKWN